MPRAHIGPLQLRAAEPNQVKILSGIFFDAPATIFSVFNQLFTWHSCMEVKAKRQPRLSLSSKWSFPPAKNVVFTKAQRHCSGEDVLGHTKRKLIGN